MDKLQLCLDRIYQEQMAHVWNIALGDSVSTVTIHFTFPRPEYARELHRLRTTRRHGKITELGNGRVDYTVTVKSELELVPWIRSFGPCAVVDAGQSPTLAARLKADWKEAMTQYGIVP